jgi:hypothetical protein
MALNAAGNQTGDFGLATALLADPGAFAAAGLDLGGVVGISQGFMLLRLVGAAISAHLGDRRFGAAAV